MAGASSHAPAMYRLERRAARVVAASEDIVRRRISKASAQRGAAGGLRSSATTLAVAYARHSSLQTMLRRAFSTSARSASKDWTGILEKHWSPAVPRAPKGNNLVVDYAKGSWITEYGTGRKYLDLQTGIGVANTGHCHPR